MPKPAIFFDRDNTLIASDGYLGDPEGVVLMDGAADAVARARELGFAVVVISNQSGVARGMFSEDAVRAVNARIDQLLQRQNPTAIIDRHEFCPFHPKAVLEKYRHDSDLRKPKPGMLKRAAEAMELDLPASWLIGDAPRDIEAGQAAGVHTILLRDPNNSPSPAALEASSVDPDEEVSSLRELLEAIAATVLPPPAAPPHMRLVSDEPEVIEEINAPDAVAAALAEPDDDEDQDDLEPPIPPMPEPGMPPAAAPAPTAEPGAATAARPSPDDDLRNDSPGAAPTPDLSEITALLHQLLQEIRRRPDQPQTQFSISKLMAGVAQALAAALLLAGYFYHGDTTNNLLLAAVFFQTLTIALLMMGSDMR